MMWLMAKRGRPRGLNLNPIAIEDLLIKAGISKGDLADAAEVSTGHLADMLYRRKGASLVVVHRMSDRLGCKPETIAPALLDQFVSVREGDPIPDEAA